MSRIDHVIAAGSQEVWNVRSSNQPHTFYIHGATFHVLEGEGEEPGTEETVSTTLDRDSGH